MSHDRVFLDNVVTSTLAFEGDGRVVEYVGGYDDWQRQRAAASVAEPPPRALVDARQAAAVSSPATTSSSSDPARPKKLSFKEQREFDGLPDRIAILEQEQAALQAAIHGSDFYKSGAEAIRTALARVAALDAELAAAYARWEELDARSS